MGIRQGILIPQQVQMMSSTFTNKVQYTNPINAMISYRALKEMHETENNELRQNQLGGILASVASRDGFVGSWTLAQSDLPLFPANASSPLGKGLREFYSEVRMIVDHGALNTEQGKQAEKMVLEAASAFASGNRELGNHLLNRTRYLMDFVNQDESRISMYQNYVTSKESRRFFDKSIRCNAYEDCMLMNEMNSASKVYQNLNPEDIIPTRIMMDQAIDLRNEGSPAFDTAVTNIWKLTNAVKNAVAQTVATGAGVTIGVGQAAVRTVEGFYDMGVLVVKATKDPSGAYDAIMDFGNAVGYAVRNYDKVWNAANKALGAHIKTRPDCNIDPAGCGLWDGKLAGNIAGEIGLLFVPITKIAPVAKVTAEATKLSQEIAAVTIKGLNVIEKFENEGRYVPYLKNLKNLPSMSKNEGNIIQALSAAEKAGLTPLAPVKIEEVSRTFMEVSHGNVPFEKFVGENFANGSFILRQNGIQNPKVMACVEKNIFTRVYDNPYPAGSIENIQLGNATNARVGEIGGWWAGVVAKSEDEFRNALNVPAAWNKGTHLSMYEFDKKLFVLAGEGAPVSAGGVSYGASKTMQYVPLVPIEMHDASLKFMAETPLWKAGGYGNVLTDTQGAGKLLNHMIDAATRTDSFVAENSFYLGQVFKGLEPSLIEKFGDELFRKKFESRTMALVDDDIEIFQKVLNSLPKAERMQVLMQPTYTYEFL